MGMLKKLMGMFSGAQKGTDDPNRRKSVAELRNKRPLNLEKRFEHVKKASRGSTCEYYEVRESGNDKVMGLKIVLPGRIEPYRARFEGMKLPSEGEITAAFFHPKIVRLLEFGVTTDGGEYLLLEQMGGPRVDQLIASEDAFSLEQRLRLLPSMIEAVHEVHQQGFLHRDICPRNFVTDRSKKEVKLFDFGFSVPDEPAFRKRTARSGSPLYMAPEIIRRREIGTFSDMFSLGATLYHFLSGQHPWGVEDNSSKSTLLFDSTAPRPIRDCVPQITDRLATAIDQCLVANPDKRIKHCKQFWLTSGDLSAT